jgi:hypothetical protein
VDNATSRRGAVNTATRLLTGNPKNLVPYPAEAKIFYILQSVHIDSGVYENFYSMNSEGVGRKT